MNDGHTPKGRERRDANVSARSAPMSLRTRMALSFGVLFAIILFLVSLIRTFGLPWTADRGSYGDAEELVLRQLSIVADLVFSHAVVEQRSAEAGDEGRVLGVVMLYVDGDQFITPLLYTGGGIGDSAEIVLVTQDRRIITSLKYPLPDGAQATPLEYRIQSQPAGLAAPRTSSGPCGARLK